MELEQTKTGLGYMINAYKMGGPYLHIISFMAIIVLFVAIFKLYQIFVRKQYNHNLLGFILMGGSFAVAAGVLLQILGIVEALETIRVATDISPQIVYAGTIISFYSTIWGLMVFLFAVLLYFILKEIVKAKTRNK